MCCLAGINKVDICLDAIYPLNLRDKAVNFSTSQHCIAAALTSSPPARCNNEREPVASCAPCVIQRSDSFPASPPTAHTHDDLFRSTPGFSEMCGGMQNNASWGFPESDCFVFRVFHPAPRRGTPHRPMLILKSAATGANHHYT